MDGDPLCARCFSETVTRGTGLTLSSPAYKSSENRTEAYGAPEVVAGALAVELASAGLDVAGAVAVDPGLRLEAIGAGIAHVEGDRLEDREHVAKVV
eukprot:1255075-Rhodomonas_salina.3